MPQWFARKASLSEALPAHASSASRMPVSVGMKSPCVHRCRWGSQAAGLRLPWPPPSAVREVTLAATLHTAWVPGNASLLPPCHQGPLLSAQACVPFLCLCLSVSPSFPISPSLYLFLCLCLSLPLSLSFHLSLCLGLFLHLCLCFQLPLLPFISLSLSSSVFLSFYPSLLGTKAAHTMCVKLKLKHCRDKSPQAMSEHRASFCHLF